MRPSRKDRDYGAVVSLKNIQKKKLDPLRKPHAAGEKQRPKSGEHGILCVFHDSRKTTVQIGKNAGEPNLGQIAQGRHQRERSSRWLDYMCRRRHEDTRVQLVRIISFNFRRMLSLWKRSVSIGLESSADIVEARRTEAVVAGQQDCWPLHR